MRQLSITDTIFGNENQTCVFTYDEFSRVTKDNCGSAWGAAYAYDLFGNMAKSTIAGSPGTSFQPTYNVSSIAAAFHSQNTFIGQFLGGNTVSGLTDIGLT
jgi:hypothetical protein